MFEGRFAEILLIFVLALVILGPEKLPKVAAEFGRWVGRARTMARQFREQLEEEVRLEEVRKAAKPAAAPPPALPDHSISSTAAAEPAQAAAGQPSPSTDVAAAMNPHTMQASPIDVTALPPALAQAAQEGLQAHQAHPEWSHETAPAEASPEPPPAGAPHGDGPTQSAAPPQPLSESTNR